MALSDHTSNDVVTDAFEQHYRHLVDLAYRVLGDRDEAEEIAADALVRLRDQPVAEADIQQRLAWLRRVTVNGSLNRLRSRNRAQARHNRAARLDQPLRHASADEASPSATVVAAETRQEVRGVLASLPPRQASCLLLGHAGLTHTEIAEALDIARGSVGVLRSRGEDNFRTAWLARFDAAPDQDPRRGETA